MTDWYICPYCLIPQEMAPKCCVCGGSMGDARKWKDDISQPESRQIETASMLGHNTITIFKGDEGVVVFDGLPDGEKCYFEIIEHDTGRHVSTVEVPAPREGDVTVNFQVDELGLYLWHLIIRHEDGSVSTINGQLEVRK